MRAIVLAIVAIQIGLAHPASAENAADSGRSISEMLPLYNQNHCGDVKDPADQVFCGDPQLNAAAAKLNSAIQNRLDRLPDRRHAIDTLVSRQRLTVTGTHLRIPRPAWLFADDTAACLF